MNVDQATFAIAVGVSHYVALRQTHKMTELVDGVRILIDRSVIPGSRDPEVLQKYGFLHLSWHNWLSKSYKMGIVLAEVQIGKNIRTWACLAITDKDMSIVPKQLVMLATNEHIGWHGETVCYLAEKRNEKYHKLGHGQMILAGFNHTSTGL